MAPAFVVGLIVTVVHAPLGIEVLKRGIVFIDLATAQVVGLSIIVLGLWIEEPSWLVRQSDLLRRRHRRRAVLPLG